MARHRFHTVFSCDFCASCGHKTNSYFALSAAALAPASRHATCLVFQWPLQLKKNFDLASCLRGESEVLTLPKSHAPPQFGLPLSGGQSLAVPRNRCTPLRPRPGAAQCSPSWGGVLPVLMVLISLAFVLNVLAPPVPAQCAMAAEDGEDRENQRTLRTRRTRQSQPPITRGLPSGRHRAKVTNRYAGCIAEIANSTKNQDHLCKVD